MKDLLRRSFALPLCTCLIAAALSVAAAPVHAQPITSNVGPSLGAHSIGEVSFGLTASGGSGGPYTWSVVSGALPPGITLRSDLPGWMAGFNAALWGIATTPGTYAFTLRVTDGVNSPVDQATEMRITPFAVTNPWQLPDAFAGTPYSYQFSTIGAAGPVTWTDTSSPALPAGMSLSSSGVLTIGGVAPGMYNVAFSVTDGLDTLWRGASVRVSALNITSDILPNATQGASYSATIGVSGGAAPYTFTLNGGLPSGLSMNAAGGISGTVNTGPGRFSFNVSVIDSSAPANSYSRNVTVMVVGTPKKLPSIQPYGGTFSDCTLGVACTQGISINAGGSAPFTWSASGLPPGLSIGSASGTFGTPGDGEINGWPTTAGDYTVTITATDNEGASVTNSFPFRVSTMAARHDGVNGTIGAFLSVPIRVIGGTPFGTGAMYTAALVSGRMPVGMTFDPANLVMSGTPAENGGFNPVFDFTDAGGSTLRATIPFFVSTPGPNIHHNGYLGSWTTGSSLSQQLNACCAPGYSWSVVGGAMPPGMTLSSGGLLNAPALNTPGDYWFIVQVQDTFTGNVSAVRFTILVTPLTTALPPELNFGNVGSGYDVDLTVTGASGAVTWSLEPFNYLPPGLQLTSSGGVWSLDGTPTHSGQYTFRLRATDSAGNTLVRDFTVSVYPANAAPPVAITTYYNFGTWTIGEVHQPLSATGGMNSYTWTVVGGALPPGVALRQAPFLPPWFSTADSAGLIGVATTPGTYTFRLRAASGSESFERDFTVRVTSFTIDDWFNLPDAFAGHGYSYQLTASGNAGPVTWTPSGPLPPGFALSAAGVLSSSGAGLVPGFYGVNVAVNDGAETIFRTVSLSVFAIRITTPGELPNATQNAAYTTTISASGGTGVLTFTANCCLPFGLTLASDGTISGTPNTGPGRYGFDVTATDQNATSYSRRMAIVVVGEPPALPAIFAGFDDCTFGVPCSRTVWVQNGGSAPFTWTAAGLPAGLAIRSGSGNTSRFVTPGDAEIIGLPRQIGTFNVTVTVTGADGGSATQTFPLRVSRLLARDFFNAGDRGVPYSGRIRIIGGEPGYTSTIVSGKLPAGLSLDAATQAVAGTPEENGSFSFTLDVIDSANPANALRTSQFLQIGGGGSTIAISSSDLGTAQIPSASFSQMLFACCVPGTFTWSAESAPPAGLTLSPSGVLSGSISAGATPGAYTFRVRAAHSSNPANYGIRDVTLTLTKLSIGGGFTLADGNVGAAYTHTFSASGTAAAQTWTLAPSNLLPPGLTLASSGVLSGTPTGSGQFFFTVIVTDTDGNVASRQFVVSIYPAGTSRPVALVNFGPNFIAQRGVFTQGISAFNVSGGTGPYTFSLTPGAPQVPGMRVLDDPPFPTNLANPSTLAVYAGVLAEPGLYQGSIRVTDGNGAFFDRSFTVNVTPLALLSQFSLPRVTRNVPYAFQMEVTGGSGNYLWTASGLPAGLTLDPTTGLISGVTATSSTFTGIFVAVTDQSTGASANGNFSLQIDAFAIATNGVLPTGKVNVPYSVTLSAPGCSGACTWFSAGGSLPSGLALNGSTGVLSGTPTGTFSGTLGFQVNGTGGSAARQFSLVILSDAFPVVSVTSTVFADQTVGSAVGLALTAQGGAPPYTWALDSGSLPPGITLVSSAENYSATFGSGMSYLTGRVIEAGSYSFTLRVTDQDGSSATQAYTWNISRLSQQYSGLPIFGGNPLVYAQAYSQPLLVLGGSNSYPAWSALAPLPAGLALHPASGVVSGTPANTGFFPGVPVRVIDSDGNTLTSNVSFSIGGGLLSFPPPNLGTVQLGAAASFNINPTGPGPITLTAQSPLPPGFAITSAADPVVGGSSGGFQLTGTPLAAGTFSFTLRADGPGGAFAVRTFALTVAPFILPGNLAALPDTFAGNGVYSQQLVAFGASAGATWALAPGSRLPDGLSLSSTGVLSGTPGAAGGFSFAVDITDAGVTVRRIFTLNVSAIGLSDNGILPVATTLTPYSHTFTGGGAGIFWSSTPLPAGLTLSSSTGEITGTPTARGTFAFTVTATDGLRPISRRFTLYVRNPIQPVLSIPPQTTDLGSASVGQQTNVTLTVNDGVPPYSWSVASGSSLPPGLGLLGPSVLTNLNPGGAAIAGTPTTAGTYSFSLCATDGAGTTVCRGYVLRVPPFNVLGGNPPAALAGSPYARRFAAVGGTAPHSFAALPADASIVDPLPPGITLGSDGTLAGTTSSTGTYNFFLQVSDADGNLLRKLISLQVNNAGGVRVTNQPVFSRAAGGGFALRLATSATPATDFTWSLQGGSLPPGVTFATGLSPTQFPNATWLAGRVAAPGEYSFTVRATETANVSNVADHRFTFKISPMQFVDPAWELFNVLDAPSGRVGDPYSFTFKVAGGTAPYTFAASPFDPLPAGLTLSPAGVLSGVPAAGAAGQYSITPIVTDANGDSAIAAGVTLVIAPAGTVAPLARSGGNPPSASAGVPYAFALDGILRGGTAPFTWAAVAGQPLPPGLSIVAGANGVSSYLSGTPTAASTTPYSFALEVSDSSGPAQSITVLMSMRVSALALSPDALPNAGVGVPYSQMLTPSGGVAPYTVQLLSSSGLPPGMTLSGAGVLSGVPDSPGNFVVQVLVSDASGQTLSKLYTVVVDNAQGQAPAASLSPKPIQIYYEVGSPNPAPIGVGVTTSSGSLPFTALLSGIPGASLSATSGTTSTALTLNVIPSSVPVGTYAGLIAARVPGAVNHGDWTPVTLTVAPAPPCTFAVNPQSGSAATAGGSGSFAVSAGYTCAWTAVASHSWVQITAGSSGTGNGTVSFSVDANLSAGARTATITVNGAVYTLTQWGTDALNCSFVINPQAVSATSAGGNATVTITASNALCSWTASSSDMSVSPAAGTGNGSVNVLVPSNADPASRSLTASIAGHTFTANQSGINCTVGLSPYSASVPAAGVTGSVEVTTQAGCSYSTVLGPSWISVTSGASGIGPGMLVYSVDANSTTVERTGALTIGGQSFTITQAALACSVTVDTAALGSPFGSGVSGGTIQLTANGANCAWAASSGVPWASVSPLSGTGNRTLDVFVSSNAAATVGRSGSLTIAGQTINITQAGTSCSFTLDAASGAAPAAGGTGSVRVFAPGACAWTASSNAAWLSIVSSGASGTSEVQFAAAANGSAAPRSGTLTIAGLTYTVNQAGAPCSYSITGTATSPTLAAEGVGGQSFDFTATFPGCAPAAVSYANWITVSATAFAGTSGSAAYSVAPNPYGAPRSGTIVVGNAVYTVRQSGSECAFSLNAYGRIFQASGGAETVRGTPTAVGCTPDVGTDQPSFILLAPLTGPVLDIFSLPYSIAPFPASLTTGVRFGRITFGGQIVTIKQFSW